MANKETDLISHMMRNANDATATRKQQESPSHLEGLNPEQLAAVQSLGHPTLVVAGAGTGKTKVLTSRLAHELYTGRVQPWQILAVTFTNKAAREMQDRVYAMMRDPGDAIPWLGTFHHVGGKLLRRHAELCDRNSNFSILDTMDQMRVARDIIRAERIDEKRWPPRYLASLIDSWKNRALLPDQVSQTESNKFADGRGADLYEQYQRELVRYNAVDFGDLILLPYQIARKNPEILRQWRDKFRTVLVDEYQDTNTAQYLWLRLIVGDSKNICCVGDDDQAIYGWRGAQVKNMLRFETDFPGAQVIRLEQNYRSSGHILAVADSIIASNQDRLGKRLWTKSGMGNRVLIRCCQDEQDEASMIAFCIEDDQNSSGGTPLSEMAVLVRTTHQMRAIEEQFALRAIAYRVIGGLRFYERAEIRDALAYLHTAVNPHSNLHLQRILNTPKRGVGSKSQADIISHARNNSLSLYNGIIDASDKGIIRGAAKRNLDILIGQIESWNRELNSRPAGELAAAILDQSGLSEELKKQATPESEGKIENLKELIGQVSKADDIPLYLENISLLIDNSTTAQEAERVSIMTLHAAKGLEFSKVFLPGWEEDLFPSKRSLEEAGGAALEEERRLAYVGITRARHQLLLFWSSRRNVFGQWQSRTPSRFFSAISPANVAFLNPDGSLATIDDSPEPEEIPDQATYLPPSRSSTHSHSADDFTDIQPTRPSVTEQPWTVNQTTTPTEYASVPQPHPQNFRHLAQSEESCTKGVVASKEKWTAGNRLKHRKFGEGTVISVDSEALLIEFDKYGRRRIMALYAQKYDTKAES